MYDRQTRGVNMALIKKGTYEKAEMFCCCTFQCEKCGKQIIAKKELDSDVESISCPVCGTMMKLVSTNIE